MQIVNIADDHPVRLGQESIRFEVQPGDCGADDPKHGDWSDCKEDRERHELSGRYMKNGSTWWYAWSIYLQPEFKLNKLYPGVSKIASPPSHSNVIGVTNSLPKFKSTVSISFSYV